MIVTDHFVYIHVSRTGGTFLNRLILNEVPGARMLRYHGRLEDLPVVHAQLPVIGFARNPWDWYVSMFHDYCRKRQFVFQILSDEGILDFERTIVRFLNLGDGSVESRGLLRHLAAAAPVNLSEGKPGRNHLPGLRAEDFVRYPANIGYFSWLFGLMLPTQPGREIHIGRFENLRQDALRLFRETGVPMTNRIVSYLEKAPPLNASSRPRGFDGAFSPELKLLIAEREHAYIARFRYESFWTNKLARTQ